MVLYQIILGYSATLLALISFVPYFRDIFRGKTKPHVFTWFVWGLLTGTAFFVQISEGAGIGAWVTGIESLGCFAITVLALWHGEKNITRVDWVCFVAALGGIVLWKLTDNPLLAIILIALVDILAFIPTFRKAYYKPQEETVSQFSLSAMKWVLGIAALESFALTIWLYPAVLVFLDSSLVIMLLVRRKQLAK